MTNIKTCPKCGTETKRTDGKENDNKYCSDCGTLLE